VSLLLEIASWVLIVVGGAFTVVGAFGMLRFPELYTRMHAAGVIDPFGVSLMLIGLMFQAGFSLVTAKLIFIVAFLVMTSPVACHALGRAARHRGLPPLLATKGEPPSTS
jgi:multicomponent Na+:H+ antiporter subunit G